MNKIEALLFEREGYLRRGLKDRAKQVDLTLAALGYETKRSEPVIETATAEPVAERAATPRVTKRKA